MNVVLSLALLLVPVPVTAQVDAPVIITDAPHEAYTLQPEANVPETIPELLERKLAGNPQKQVIIKTLTCESSLNPQAVGDYGHSFGLAQIYLPAWPAITKEQALDPEFAIDFMSEKFAAGYQHLWTCWRLHQ